ncbi:MAG: hypothetical protein OXH03_12040 [Bacteroidetes bacterium]|nr:hypothetical protein [Bacteroidota bacterium]MXW82492.1 hypothetical protein [Rhodothermaceae bacterium]MDE2671657.1 hypothetical protein [Bacteroidota bacterium]MXZ04913.1 hypothetical protein [Rhodothermaceae bacterium]MYD20403.1 hypothetical protein [Rhodothermaceae bacterium]
MNAYTQRCLLKFGTVLVGGLVCTLCAHAQITRLPHADTTSGNYFGTSVALDGSRAIVGASGEASCGVGAGAAYIFELADSTGYWHEKARLVPSDCEEGLAFGRKVALDGNVALVAGTQEYFATERSNAVYVFERNDTGNWTQTGRLTSTGHNREGPAGAAVAVHDDRILFTTAGDATRGSQLHGTAYIYEKVNGTWSLKQRVTGSDDVSTGIFGGSATLHLDRLAVAGSAYFSGRAGSVYLFESDREESWSEIARLGGIEGFFISLDLHGDELLVGQTTAGRNESGQATLFARDSTGAWIKTATLEPPTPYRKGAFGTEVALYGDRALVVGYDEQLRLNFNVDRVVYIFARSNGQWHYQGIIDIGEAAFGNSIDLYKQTALIGAAGSTDAGAAYVIQIR